jgi:hypothetical protein
MHGVEGWSFASSCILNETISFESPAFYRAKRHFNLTGNIFGTSNACTIDSDPREKPNSGIVIQKTLFSTWGCSFEQMMATCQKSTRADGTHWCKGVMVPVGYSGQSSPG